MFKLDVLRFIILLGERDYSIHATKVIKVSHLGIHSKRDSHYGAEPRLGYCRAQDFPLIAHWLECSSSARPRILEYPRTRLALPS